MAGIVAAMAAWAVSELAAAVLDTSAPLISVGDATVDLSPSWLKDAAIAMFGVYDKIALLVGMTAVLLLIAAVIGLVAMRRRVVGMLAVAGLGVLGVLSVLTRRNDDALAVAPVLAATITGVVVLMLMVGVRRRDRRDPPVPDSTPADGESTPVGSASRRGFLVTGASVAAASAVTGSLGLFLGRGGSAEEARAAMRLPDPDFPLPPLPDGVDFGVRGLAPFTTPNSDFYRIDTALTVPRVSPDDWSLRIDGMVDNPIDLDYDALLRLPLVEADITMTCVSNEIGGDLVGNTRWLGVRLGDLLREAGVHSDADQILSTSTDGWTCGTPAEVVLDGRDAILAIAMDGEALPFRHGFPVRMVTPGIYGYVGSTKWLDRITLTRFDQEEAYWAQRGWAVRAPIKTMSRIDVPGPLENVPSGTTTIAGVAWAQQRGVDAVEISVDDGEWTEVELAEVPGIDTWTQWRTETNLTPGRHSVRVRATDGTGTTQTEERVDPIPDGASGWHTVQVVAE